MKCDVKSNFIQVDFELLKIKELSHLEILLYSHILNLWNAKPKRIYFYTSKSQTAVKFGVSIRYIYKAIHNLEMYGLIKKQEYTDISKHYGKNHALIPVYYKKSDLYKSKYQNNIIDNNIIVDKDKAQETEQIIQELKLKWHK